MAVHTDRRHPVQTTTAVFFIMSDAYSIGRHAFFVAGAHTWNDLLVDVTSPQHHTHSHTIILSTIPPGALSLYGPRR